MAIADASVWVDGARVDERIPFDRVLETAAERGGFAWIDLVDPSEAELLEAARELELHRLVVEDVLQRGQRPKLEPYDGTAYCVLHRVEQVGDALVPREVHAIVADRCAITVSWDRREGLADLRARLASGLELLTASPATLLYALLDETADQHAELADLVRQRIAAIEESFFGQEDPATVEVYLALRRMVVLERAAEPMSGIVERFAARVPRDGGVDADELQRHLRDVDDHARQTAARLDGAQRLLTSLLQLASARVAERQNEEMRAMTELQLVQNDQTKKVTSWAAILFAPTLIAGIYGMNFRHLPELEWLLGYPFSLLLMVLLAGGLYVAFKRRGWL
ncbi:magnesium and cobalt transport protein CorA [Agrococcus sp. HG114]|uniref:magnesium and cobalt transport protein CorA n=1 Tax=Agrococcus sp. HG114 TaxID=2969757 RepID=UPI00215B24DA|nr:magnesium and cobalt transport protein CorA [Agrococcus sp. HG114]MCR8671368.1 magnesium and cobalt transport protein CorA [Agrococcus sp. HG114]